MTAMTGDSYRLMRYRLDESIVPLSFAAEQLVAYSHAQGAVSTTSWQTSSIGPTTSYQEWWRRSSFPLS
jgi:tartrate dehydratase beta subunit/fumarate hydratase class I family protein